MDPFKKSLGINFGSLFSAPNKGANREEPPQGDDKKSSAELLDILPPDLGDDPIIIITWHCDGTVTVDVLDDGLPGPRANPLNPTQPRSGFRGRVYDSKLDTSLGSPYPNNPEGPISIANTTKDSPGKKKEKPCIEERSEIDEKKSEGIRVIRNYKRPCGSDTWDCTETWMDTSGKSKGIGFIGDKGKSNIVKIQSCFEPGFWSDGNPATEEEKSLVRKAAEEIFNNECLDNIPGLRDCLKKQWKETSLGFNDQQCKNREHSYKLGLGGHTDPKWYSGRSNSLMYLCRKNMTNKGKIDYT